MFLIVNGNERRSIISRVKKGVSLQKVADEFGISRRTVARVCDTVPVISRRSYLRFAVLGKIIHRWG